MGGSIGGAQELVLGDPQVRHPQHLMGRLPRKLHKEVSRTCLPPVHSQSLPAPQPHNSAQCSGRGRQNGHLGQHLGWGSWALPHTFSFFITVEIIDSRGLSRH